MAKAGAAVPSPRRRYSLQVAMSPLVILPGARAFHTSIIIDDDEYWFSEAGINIGDRHGDLASHAKCSQDIQLLDFGTTSVSGTDLLMAVGPYFKNGSYDLLLKNCNTFADVSLWYMIGRRLQPGYIMLDRLAVRYMNLARMLLQGDYETNENASKFDLEALISMLKPASTPPEETNTSGLECRSFGSLFSCMCSEDHGDSAATENVGVPVAHTLPLAPVPDDFDEFGLDGDVDGDLPGAGLGLGLYGLRGCHDRPRGPPTGATLTESRHQHKRRHPPCGALQEDAPLSPRDGGPFSQRDLAAFRRPAGRWSKEVDGAESSEGASSTGTDMSSASSQSSGEPESI